MESDFSAGPYKLTTPTDYFPLLPHPPGGCRHSPGRYPVLQGIGQKLPCCHHLCCDAPAPLSGPPCDLLDEKNCARNGIVVVEGAGRRPAKRTGGLARFLSFDTGRRALSSRTGRTRSRSHEPSTKDITRRFSEHIPARSAGPAQWASSGVGQRGSRASASPHQAWIQDCVQGACDSATQQRIVSCALAATREHPDQSPTARDFQSYRSADPLFHPSWPVSQRSPHRGLRWLVVTCVTDGAR